jgi:hypothetical protein
MEAVKEKSARQKVLESLKFTQKEKVRVIPIVRRSDWLPENHDGEFLNQGAKLDIVVPHDESRDHLKDPLAHLDPKEKGKLAKRLGLDGADDLNPLKRHDNYWQNRYVRLKREGLILQTDDAYDYIRLCILLSDTDRIAPSWSNRNDKYTYRFAVVRESDETKEEESTIDIKSQAYELFSDIRDNQEALEAILWIRYYEMNTYAKPPVNPSYNYAKIEVGKMVDANPKDFIEIAGSKDYETKLLVYQGLKYDILVREGQQVRFKSSATPLGLFSDAVKHFDMEKHQEDKRILQEKVDEKKKS